MSGRIDLSTLGFEISFDSSDHEAFCYCDCNCHEEHEHGEEEQPQDKNTRLTIQDDEEQLRYDIYAADDISGVSSVSEYSLTDDEESKDHPPRKPMPKRSFGPGRNTSLGYEDLGYEDLGYVPADQQQAERQTSIRKLSMGRPVENRRSMGMGQRRGTSESRSLIRRRLSVASGSTASSYASSKMRKAHTAKRRQAQRERMVSRSAQRRLSRQEPLQLYPCHQRTLEELVCNPSIFENSNRRMPRSVSLQYYDSQANNHKYSSVTPTSVNLKFDDQKGPLPRRVSISFNQRVPRKGSLDFSKGIDHLPRQFYEKEQQFRRATIGGQAMASPTSRRASAGSFQRRNSRQSVLSTSRQSVLSISRSSILSQDSASFLGACQDQFRRSSCGGGHRRSSSIGFSPHQEEIKEDKPTVFRRGQSAGDICCEDQRRRSSCGTAGRRSSCGGSMVRRGSLDFSVGTSQLPRRKSIGQSSTGTANNGEECQHHHHPRCPRKCSMAPGRVPRKQINRTISPVRTPSQNDKQSGKPTPLPGVSHRRHHSLQMDFLIREHSWTNLNQQPNAMGRVA